MSQLQGVCVYLKAAAVVVVCVRVRGNADQVKWKVAFTYVYM